MLITCNEPNSVGISTNAKHLPTLSKIWCSNAVASCHVRVASRTFCITPSHHDANLRVLIASVGLLLVLLSHHLLEYNVVSHRQILIKVWHVRYGVGNNLIFISMSCRIVVDTDVLLQLWLVKVQAGGLNDQSI